jgi:hypothetical protein
MNVCTFLRETTGADSDEEEWVAQIPVRYISLPTVAGIHCMIGVTQDVAGGTGTKCLASFSASTEPVWPRSAYSDCKVLASRVLFMDNEHKR